ncbi:uncharacterized protein LOC105836163 [Monomorium pharaonis]|uniref:uncharacterized protein LOC105836163 n=1 Tax=Monomorium pharaonis TaxID=307658 RepID=UPI001747B501|nr:uncharacterized protein LOC105836163 [Monomorium pharaonis]
MNSVIWNKMKKAFVPISSVPMFAMMQQENLRQSRALETHNFQLQNLTLTSFEEPYFLEFYDNDTKVTGLCGELWILLSEKLNFTLQPVRSNEIGLGVRNETIYPNGLLGLISRNETIAIPKVEMFNTRRTATEFTVPLWLTKQRLYIHSDTTAYDNTWMAKVFSWKIWCFILVMYLLLSVCSFWSQIILERIENNSKRSTISDHIFYNFGMLCNQGSIPNILNGRSKIVEIVLGLFCSILYMAFGALLFVFIAKKVSNIPPFDNLDTLLTDTSYKVIVLNGSIGDIAFKGITREPYVGLKNEKRVIISSTIEEMFKLVCKKGKKKYTVFQSTDEYKTRKVECRLTSIGDPYHKTWAASGIVRNFKYKRTIDLGILRLKEVGLWKALKHRWLTNIHQHSSSKIIEAIRIDQVSLIILMMCCGIIIAVIIFIIEKIVYAYKQKLS